MHDQRTHPLLAQVPLTVSPFISLPSAPTLPYTYQTLPSTLPPPSTGDPLSSTNNEKTRFVVSSTGHAAHPDEIIESCRGLQAHLVKLQEDATRLLRDWEDAIKERELAEKRSMAPGWLDRDEKLLEPERRREMVVDNKVDGLMTSAKMRMPSEAGSVGGGDGGGSLGSTATNVPPNNNSNEGEELDRAFGGLGFR